MNISTVLNNTGNTAALLTSFNALDIAQQKVLLSSKLLTEEQKVQCLTMTTLSSANTKYTAEQLTKATGISAETLATWGLTEATDTLTMSQLAEMASSDAQAKTVLDKIIAQNAQAVANGEVTASNIALASSEGGTTLATGAFTTAIKANISAMWTWMTTTPLGWLTLLAAGVFAAVKAYDALTVSVEEQKEKMEESLSAYEDAKSELSGITTELENQEQAMNELLAKEKLTYAEKGQLEELQAITRELRIQKDLAEKEEDRTEKQLAKDATDLFDKQFGDYEISEQAINKYQSDADITGNNVILISDENDISAMIAGYKQFNELLDEAYGSGSQYDIDHFKSLTEDLEDSIFTTAQELQTQQDNISAYYESIKNTPYEDLTTEQKEIVDTYNAISNAIALIYQQLDPNTWNSMQVDNIFSTDGIEKTKDELVAMAQSGELTPETIKGYTNLNNALGETTLSAQDLCNELYAIADAQGEVQDSTLINETDIPSIDKLSEALDKIQSAYQSVQSAIEEYNEEGYLSVDTFQSLMELEPQYLNMLLDENGNLNLTTGALYENTKAYLENLGVKAALNLIDNTSKYIGEAEQLKYLTQTTNEATEATWGLVQERLNAVATVSSPAVMEALQNRINSIQSMTNAAIAGIGKGGLGKSTSDKKDKSKDKTADKIKDINDQLNDLAKSEALDALKYKFDQIEQSVEKLDTTISQLETTLDLTAEDDYISKIGTVGKQMEYASQKTELLRNEFSQLQSEKYISADMANEIASRMKSVADSIAENRKNIIEYGKNITEYYMSALTSVGKLSKETIDESTDLFDRNVKTLSEGGLTGLQFNLSPTVPESAYEIQRAENESLEDEMRRYYDTVAEMQKIALDMQYQETVADNARKRQDLLDSLNEAYASQQSYSSKTIGLQKATNNTVKAEQQATNAQTSAVQEADYAKKESTQEVFVESIMDNWKRLKEFTENMFIVAPKVDNDSWDKLAEDIEDKVKKIGQSFSDFDLPRGGMDGALSSATRGTTEKSTTGNGIVDTAMKYLGVPYVWGGTSPSGFDCSGFTYYVFGKNGKTIPRTAQYQYRGGQAVSRTALSPGDLVFFKGTYGTMTNPGHVAIYIGDNKIIEAPRTGESVKINYLSSKSNYVGARRYAKGTRDFPIFGRKVNGIAGENYKDEILMHKKTGEITKINEPTFIDTNEYDVVGEDTTARVLKQYATGTPPTDKEVLSYIKKASDATGVPANVLMAVMDQENGYQWSDGARDTDGYSYGYMMLYDKGALADMDPQRRQLAMTDRYTNVLEGAKILASNYKELGDWGDAAAAYNMGMGGFKAKGRNTYGDEVINRAYSEAFIEAAKNIDALVASSEETAKNTTVIRKDFKTQIQEMINGVKGSATTEDSNKWEDNLLEYIKEKTADSKKSTETYVENFEKLAQYQKDSETLFKDIDKQLLNAVGTPDFAKVRTQGNQQIQDYIAAIMGMQVDMETAQIKEQFAYAKDIQRIALEYYNERKENEATADELLAIADAYSEITSQVNELSDAYVDAIKAETDFLSNNAQNKMKKYADELSWINDEWDELERKLEKTDDEKDLVLQDNLFKAELENLNKQTEVYIRQQREAHQNVLDLYANKEYSPIFDRFDIESWFDANGEITSQFNDDVARMGAYDETSHLVPLMNQLVELIKTYKQSWYEAADAIVDVEDNIQNVKDAQEEKENNRMLARVDKYVEYQERLMEALDFEKSMNDAVSTAKSSYYDFIDSLREEQNSIDTQLKKNMQLDDWLSEDTRKQLFNLDDYNEETKEINRLQEQAQRLYENYQNDISNLSEQDAYLQESITAEYNKRTEALQDQLNIAKQQLQVKKDEAAFENALKERDTQIILGNRVQNVADPENLSNLAEAKAQSELELDNLKAKSVEAEDIRDMERISDDLAKEKAARENMVAMINEASDEYKIALANFIEPIELITAKLNSLAKYNPVDMINGDNSDEIYQSFDHEKIGTGYNFDYDYSNGVWVNDTAHIAGLENRSMYEAAKARLRNQHDYKALTDGRYSDKVFDLYNSDLSYDKNANFLHKFFKPSEAETFFKEFDVGNAKLKRMVDKTGEDVESIYKRIDLIEKYPQLKQQTRNTDNPIFKLMDIYRTLGGFMNDGLTRTYNTGATTEYHINTINIKESAKDMDSLLTQIATQAAAGIEPAYSTIKNQR